MSQNGIRAKVIENWYFQNPDYNRFSYDQNVPSCQADASRVIIIDDVIDVMLDSMFDEIFNEIRAMIFNDLNSPHFHYSL